jgi:hypothetical protein
LVIDDLLIAVIDPLDLREEGFEIDLIVMLLYDFFDFVCRVLYSCHHTPHHCADSERAATNQNMRIELIIRHVDPYVDFLSTSNLNCLLLTLTHTGVNYAGVDLLESSTNAPEAAVLNLYPDRETIPSQDLTVKPAIYDRTAFDPLKDIAFIEPAAKLRSPEKIAKSIEDREAAGAPSAAAAGNKLVTNPAAVQTALAAITAAETAIKQAGNVTGDLSLALTGCATATKWLNAALASAAAAAKTTNPPAMPVIPPATTAKA